MEALFGYVTPYKSELKIKEYEMFKANYCGLCKTMGKEFNQFVRFGLNYDLNFLALLLSSIEEDRYKIKSEACIANPIKKKPVVDTNKHLEYTSHISIILIYFKLIDDWKDERSIKSLLALIPFYSPVSKSKKKFKEKYEKIKYCLGLLSEIENEKSPVIDKAADTFGQLMEEISVPQYISDENTKKILRWLGYNLGRWIYILDAFNDIEKDLKKKCYNPILLQYNYNSEINIIDFRSKVRADIEFSLTLTLDNIAKSFELLNIKSNKEVLENIIYLGMRNRMEKILDKGDENNCERSL